MVVDVLSCLLRKLCRDSVTKPFPIKFVVQVSRGPPISTANMVGAAAKRQRLAVGATASASEAEEGTEEDAASGASEPVATDVGAAASPGPVSITHLLEMNTRQGQTTDAYLTTYASQMKAYVDRRLMSFLKEHQSNSIVSRCTSSI